MVEAVTKQPQIQGAGNKTTLQWRSGVRRKELIPPNFRMSDCRELKHWVIVAVDTRLAHF